MVANSFKLNSSWCQQVLSRGLLTATFIHLDGVGEKTEKAWWRTGITSWDEWLQAYKGGKLKRVRREWVEVIEKSKEALMERRASFFGKVLPSHEQWRCYREFQDSVVFLDIETTGMGEDDHVTVVGLYDGRTYRFFIRGINMWDLFEELHDKAVIVTYYGSNFDLPFLRRCFPSIRIPPIHIDLCFLMRRLGYTGGLKAIESKLGMRRKPEIEGLGGWDAVKLWQRYKRFSDGDALKLLVKYNQADVVNLKPIMEFAYSEMAWRLLREALRELP